MSLLYDNEMALGIIHCSVTTGGNVTPQVEQTQGLLNSTRLPDFADKTLPVGGELRYFLLGGDDIQLLAQDGEANHLTSAPSIVQSHPICLESAAPATSWEDKISG